VKDVDPSGVQDQWRAVVASSALVARRGCVKCLGCRGSPRSPWSSPALAGGKDGDNQDRQCYRPANPHRTGLEDTHQRVEILLEQ